MPVTATRILRTEAREIDPDPRQFTSRELDRDERIITVGRALMAQHGRDGVNLAGLAAALDISPGTFRRHYADLDELLGKIIMRHLQAVSVALGEVPADTPDLRRARRAAYIAATRNSRGGLCESHLLVVRDLHRLPEDIRTGLETTRLGLATICLGLNAARALPILDLPGFTVDEIESSLAPFLPANAATPIYMSAGEPARPAAANITFPGGKPFVTPAPAAYQPRNTTALNAAPPILSHEFNPPALATLRPG